MMRESYRNYVGVIVSGCLYSLSYFFRGSIAPITDVLVTEFNATLSQIGFMSSLFWLSYCVLQIPIGLLLQYVKTECIIFVSAFSFIITCTLFGVDDSDSIVLPSIYMLSSGILSAPFFLCFVNIVSTRFSSNALAIYGGVMQCVNAIILVSGNMLQAYLYQTFKVWRPIYWAVSIATLVSLLLFAIFNIDSLSSSSSAVDTESIEADVFDHDETKPLLPHKEKRFCSRFLKRIADKNMKDGVIYKIKTSLMNKWNWLISGHQYCCNTLQLAFNGLYLINYMSLKYGLSRELSTSISSTFWLSYAFGNVVIGKLSNKYRKRRIFYMITCLIQFIPPIYVVYGPSNTSVFVLVFCNVLSGVGNGIVTLNFVLSREYNDHFECSDVASGLLNTLSVSAGFIMNWLIGILMDYHWKQREGEINPINDDRIYSVSDYNFGFTVIPVIAVFGIILSFLVKETNGKALTFRSASVENAKDEFEISLQKMQRLKLFV